VSQRRIFRWGRCAFKFRLNCWLAKSALHYDSEVIRTVVGVVGALLCLSGLQAEPPQVGDVSFANSGAPAAQRAFLYGLAQLHNFEYEDAARAFREAQQSDPDFAIAYWGEAMTKNHPVWMEQDLGGARRILERLGPTSAARFAKGKTDRERAYLRAIETLYGGGDKNVRDLAYLEEMRRIHAAYPDDVDATAFYGLALLGSAHSGRDEVIYLRAAAELEQAFATHPNHPGLAHYLIHSYDDPEHARLGLPAAKKYFTIAPATPHALHMTSHIYLAAGMWDEVVEANEQATRVSAERAQKAGRTPARCGHANMWLMYGYLQQGRPDAARRVLDGCRTAATSANGLAVASVEQDPLDPDNSPAGSYIQMWSRYIIDTEAWSDSLVWEDLPLGDLTNAKLTRAFVRALAAARRSDAAALKNALARVQGERQALVKVLVGRREGSDRYRVRAAVLEREIQALASLAENNSDEAVALLRSAAADEQGTPIEFGPPFVDKPAYELLGDVSLAMGRATDAAADYESALKRAPNRAASVTGLARARSSKAPVSDPPR
jgi:tetratricopeptide (TPR) repeat protein